MFTPDDGEAFIGGVGNELEVIIGDGTGVAQVSEIIIGDTFSTGFLVSGLQSELVDFSAETVDQFGNATIVERDYTYDRTFPIYMPSAQFQRHERGLAAFRARKVLYYCRAADVDREIVTFGRVTSITSLLSSGGYTDGTIEISGRL